ncbi:predicted protein [Thalassiosira pseudonana CCMP1335]|uniref:Chromo domain-containing protein n=1 Tax=Thalassiosira pseudonana TaxID=35128 RepID=B8C3I7_THAPS|nr:predicted protein [Thalassiosira pseudonana CCMP1335]EED92127.1 predicted protein [Thalassiosira pseudonana CCMP1335]|eukprot:g14377.t1 g14377   contig9:1707490-1708474(+)
MTASYSFALITALSLQGCASFQPPSYSHRVRVRSISLPVLSATDDDSANTKTDDCCPPIDETSDGPDILKPFLPALDPKYSVKGPVGEEKFVLTRSGPPTKEELSNEQMLKIVKSECSDLEANTLVWKCLGYRFDEESEEWSPKEVFPNWKERFPTPPDLIGMRRVYEREVDQPSLRSNQALVRSIPPDNKQSLKTHLKPLGWKGFQYKELTPNKTRRAQCANWLIFYREELFGYTVEELRERRRLRKEAEAIAEEEAKRKAKEEGKDVDDWKLPVTEVF